MADEKELQALVPEVRTLARPTSGPLLAARGVIQRSGVLQAVFKTAKAEGWDADRLAEAIETPLREELEGTPDAVRQAAIYLAAEYTQVGDRLLLISRVTGRAIARITDEDLWQPPMQPRESGGMAKPLPRLRPELEGFLYEYIHEEARAVEIESALAVRTHQTEFLRDEGDRRLQASSKQGRRAIEQEIQGKGADVLSSASGLMRDFLRFFESAQSDEKSLALVSVALARTRTNIPDPLAVNYRFDHTQAQWSGLVNEWLREIARGLSAEAHRRGQSLDVPYPEVAAHHLQDTTLWICDPDTTSAFSRFPSMSVLQVAGVAPIGLVGPTLGALVMEPESLRIEGREMFDRWDVVGRFSYRLYVDWAKIIPLTITNLPAASVSVEVLPR